MNNFTIVGYLSEEPIENIETGEVELKVDIKKTNVNVVVKARGLLAENIIRFGHAKQLVGIKGEFENNKQLIVQKITFLTTRQMEEF